MTPERVRQALRGGYEITIEHSTSDHPDLYRGALFTRHQDFDRALARANQELDEGAALVHWRFRSLDGCLLYRSHALLTAGVSATSFCNQLDRECCAALAQGSCRGPSAVAVAKVMRFAALVLRGEATRTHASEALQHIERLLPHHRVRSARYVGGRP